MFKRIKGFLQGVLRLLANIILFPFGLMILLGLFDTLVLFLTGWDLRDTDVWFYTVITVVSLGVPLGILAYIFEVDLEEET